MLFRSDFAKDTDADILSLAKSDGGATPSALDLVDKSFSLPSRRILDANGSFRVKLVGYYLELVRVAETIEPMLGSICTQRCILHIVLTRPGSKETTSRPRGDAARDMEVNRASNFGQTFKLWHTVGLAVILGFPETRQETYTCFIGPVFKILVH